MIVILPRALGLHYYGRIVGARSDSGVKPITALNGIDLYLHVKVYN